MCPVLRLFGPLLRMLLGTSSLEVFWVCPTRRRPWGKPRTHWRDYISRMISGDPGGNGKCGGKDPG